MRGSIKRTVPETIIEGVKRDELGNIVPAVIRVLGDYSTIERAQRKAKSINPAFLVEKYRVIDTSYVMTLRDFISNAKMTEQKER